ncbi:hypothetical protein LWM68_15490 [Niabella sp. W65]|nr:hypothetical protein [Niabella sp. W65]MCH7364034.1 hypothetical protein [Niabella sp. W65]ULT39912.1 hypothetical protein KRR40_34290 [Niabella sp. I65]
MQQIQIIKVWIREKIEQTRKRWAGLSIGKQRRVLVWIFTGYTCLSALVVIKACYDYKLDTQLQDIRHIENPVLKKDLYKGDSLPNILNNEQYGKQ